MFIKKMENRNFNVCAKATASQKLIYRKIAEQEGLSLSEWIVTVLDLYVENNLTKKQPFKHKVESLSKEEVLKNRSSAYQFIDFDKIENVNKKNEFMEKLSDNFFYRALLLILFYFVIRIFVSFAFNL